MDNVVEKFIRYVKYDTKSNPESQSCPSTKKQLTLGNQLVKELNAIGLSDVSIDDNGYVMATLPPNIQNNCPTIGFIAHLDTSPDMSGENVNPKFIENYQGEDIALNIEKNVVLSPSEFPDLNSYIGDTLITTDGTTLLGADNKAGVAEIVTAMEYLVTHPEIQHGTVKIAFTPDEEIGRGANLFDVNKFGADFAYTIDGGPLGELEYENFNAAGARVIIRGRNVHPGSSKNKMINSISIAMELNSMLPLNEKPEFTEGYEGFIHLNNINGDVEETTLHYIIRDHNKELFEKKKYILQDAAVFLNKKYGEGRVELELKDQYYNMKEKIEPVMEIVNLAKTAMEEVGVIPLIKPIRGGTDGARLSYMGLPCPNIFTGGHNYHGKFEYIPVSSMFKAVDVIIKIIQLNCS